MNPFFVYLIKSTISLALFYIVFKLAVSRDKMHSVNRFVLLGILVCSAILPFADIPVFQENSVIPQVEVFRQFTETPVLNNSLTAISEEIHTVQQSKTASVNPVLLIYLFAIILLFARLIISIVRVFQIIQKAEKQPFQNYILAVVKDFIHPFSFLNKIVISEKDYSENKEMVITHEYAHITHFHAIDLIICELFTAIHWFNPFMWLLRHDLRLIHEYQADQAVLNTGIDATKYQLLVVEKAVGERRFAMANHFTQKPILKRIKMMKKEKLNRWNRVKIILFLPLLILLLQAFARPEMITKTDNLIPVVFQEDQTGKWLEKWKVENIGKGFFQPELNNANTPRKPNNVLMILMNHKNDFMIENKRVRKEDVKQIVKDYLLGKNPDGGKGPDYLESEIPYIGKIRVSNGMISFMHDLASSGEMVNYTLRTIGEVYHEVRNEKAQILFGAKYFNLENEKQEAVDKAVPVWFSYEYPKTPSSNVWLPFENQKSTLPKPVNISIKSNDEIYVEEYKYNSFEAFQDYLTQCNKELKKTNKEDKTQGFFTANLIYDADFPRSEYSKISEALHRNNFHVEQIKQLSKPLKFQLQENKLNAKMLKNEARVDSLFIQTEKEKSE